MHREGQELRERDWGRVLARDWEGQSVGGIRNDKAGQGG